MELEHDKVQPEEIERRVGEGRTGPIALLVTYAGIGASRRGCQTTSPALQAPLMLLAAATPCPDVSNRRAERVHFQGEWFNVTTWIPVLRTEATQASTRTTESELGDILASLGTEYLTEYDQLLGESPSHGCPSDRC